ncbi:MAG: SpoIIE family protein phosphatase [Scytolyngbya sp. HA4215-MV1]|jgi:sigma-B regulation protein RsbU (phosphoserine phosphatase)|nr:SpoIIE family protein phosphatase [Scytolyngbya sp. HA4215-MV1]
MNSKYASIPASILVVDDVEANRDLLSRRLERQGYLVTVAEDGRQAIALVQSQHFDLILCDIFMPEVDGYEVLAYVKTDPSLRHIPVIVVTALNEVESVVRCIELGAEDYLLKPFNPTILKARVNACLEKKRWHDQEQAYLKQLQAEQATVEERTRQLAQANAEILALNDRLKAENFRLSAELDVTRRLQQMILPRQSELEQISELDIAGFMEPADEVGGDYYDVVQHDGKIKIAIGDVTGHGLESGVVMIMAQAAVRTLIANGEADPIKFLNTINRVIYDNTRRMRSHKNMTLVLLEYEAGVLKLSGQHEELIIIRADGKVELIDTIDLGFPLGLEPEISSFVAETQVQLKSGDMAVLYTDGITEAMNIQKEQYGAERLYTLLSQHRQRSATEVYQMVIEDVRQHIGNEKLFDDLTLVVLKQK